MTENQATQTCVDELANLQKNLYELVADSDDNTYRKQFHPDLSPLGWHLGHTIFIEDFWLHQTILGDCAHTESQSALFLPENSAKAERGTALPPRRQLLEETRRRQQNNIKLLRRPPPKLAQHPLMQKDYLLLFLLQHHAMHLETMYAVLTAKNLTASGLSGASRQKVCAEPLDVKPLSFASHAYSVGSNRVECFDNEQPRHNKPLAAYSINQYAVSNGEYLSFIHAGGYQNRNYWCKQGWQWKNQRRVNAPYAWQTSHDEWFIVAGNNNQDSVSDQPVWGISRYEAQAFANWAEARLPHEHELEVAQKTGDLTPAPVWEWCENVFYPYTGYRPFPYKRYSQPWFNNKHYTLKGGSLHTHPLMHRASFRNFYTAECRHLRTGVRLAFDAWD